MKLQLMCPIGYTGYGYASLNILKALTDNNVWVGLSPIGNPSVDNETDASIVRKSIDQLLSVPYDAACIKIWHQFDLLSRIGNGQYLAFPFFEIDTMSKLEQYHLNFCDTILVSCNWAKNVLLNNNINKNIQIVPLGVDDTIFSPRTLNKTNDTYIFCTIGKWEKRKNHDIIIECFNKAFNTNDNVELWLVTHNSFLSNSEEKYWTDLVANSKLNAKIKIFPRLPSHQQVAEVISYTDCGVYISRGEGWDMELLETMAMNKPVIVSNYSAHTAYCNNDNSFLVEIDQTEPAHDNKWFFGQGNWAKFGQEQIDQTIEYMRYVYNNKISTNENGLKTSKTFSWTNTAKNILSIV